MHHTGESARCRMDEGGIGDPEIPPEILSKDRLAS